MNNIEVNNLGFETKSDLTKYIQDLFNKHEYEEEFYDLTLQRLVSKHHHYCSKNSLWPLRFKKVPHTEEGFKNGYKSMGYFIQHKLGRHDFSWRKCINPPNIFETMKIGLRKAIYPVIKEFKRHNNYECAVCEKTDEGLQVHHDPSFESMAKSVKNLINKEDKKTRFDQDWINDDNFRIRSDHPVLKEFLKIHEKSKLEYRCKKHHKHNKTNIKQETKNV